MEKLYIYSSLIEHPSTSSTFHSLSTESFIFTALRSFVRARAINGGKVLVMAFLKTDTCLGCLDVESVTIQVVRGGNHSSQYQKRQGPIAWNKIIAFNDRHTFDLLSTKSSSSKKSFSFILFVRLLANLFGLALVASLLSTNNVVHAT